MKLLLCRTIILYLCVLFAMRLMGKRQLGELQPEELVIGWVSGVTTAFPPKNRT